MKINPVRFYAPFKTNARPVNFKSNITVDEGGITGYEKFDDITSPLYKNYKGQIILNNSKVFNRDATFIFRSDIDWKELGKYLQGRFQNNDKINVYDYGCSKGLEAYSLSILLQHTQMKPERFFPIYAKDINEETVFLNKLEQSENVINGNEYEAYYNCKGALELKDEELEQYAKIKGCLSQYLTYFTDRTTRPVTFSYGNILDDVDKMDGKNPSIVFARNMWPYIEAKQYNDFAKKLYDKLAYGSVFVIGGYDKLKNNYLEDKGTITQALLSAGFTPYNGIGINIKGNDNRIVFEKNDNRKERGEIKRNGAIYNKDFTSFLRGDMEWRKLTDFIKDKYKDEEKINLYDYACSTGLEAYSLSILLQHTQTKPERFFPIKAKDIKKELIEENNDRKQSGQSNTYQKYAETKINKYLPEINFYNNEYFDASFDIDTTKITFKNKTTKPVEFSYGNILNDVDKIDNKYPSIIFARNMWPYVEASEYETFATNLYKRLKTGSMLILGSIDIIKDKLPDALIKAGFKPSHSDFCPEADSNRDFVIYEKA